MSKFLNSEKSVVVASVLSIFPEWQKWNRENINNYFEIYVKVDFDILLQREIKSLYKDAIEGKINNVVGVDIDFPEPNSNYVIDNNSDKDFDSKIDNLIKVITEKGFKF